ncbi:MAG: hypothetical protein NVS9B15_16360 [Acidobacteriaceae bacterium]
MQISVPESSKLGKDISIQGEVSGSEDLVVDGELQGIINLPASSCTLGPNSRVKARVIARSVTLAGDFEGEVFATSAVHLLKTANVRGSLVCQRISMQEGALITGSVGRDKRESDLFAQQPDPAGTADQGQLAISLS